MVGVILLGQGTLVTINEFAIWEGKLDHSRFDPTHSVFSQHDGSLRLTEFIGG